MTSPLASLVREQLHQLTAYHVPRPHDLRAKLDANESPFALPAEVAIELGRVLAAVDLHRYPYADCQELRALLARELAVEPESLVFGNGSDELITLLIATFSRPREGAARAKVLYPTPSFSVYRLASLAAGCVPIEVPLTSDMHLDESALDAHLAEHRPNIAFFARPNNPTGTVWPSATILRIARAYPDMIVVEDEAYIDYGGDSLVGHVGDLPNLVVMRTLSKIGLAALRIGFVHAHAEVRAELEKMRPPYNIGSLNQAAAVWLLDNHRELFRAACARVVAERAGLSAKLAALPGVHVFDSEANLILMRVGEPGDGLAGKVWHALAQRGVLVRNLDAPGLLSSCLRVTIGTAAENQLLVEQLTEVLR